MKIGFTTLTHTTWLIQKRVKYGNKRNEGHCVKKI